MGPLAAGLVVESLLAPFAFAALIVMPTRMPAFAEAARPAPAIAILVAIGTTYVLAFGWPLNLALGARTKIMLAAIIGLLVGLALDRGVRGARAALMIAAIGLPIWIGLPSVLLGKTASLLILLPIGAALSTLRLAGNDVASVRAPHLVILMTLAFGLAAIAAYGKAFSFAEISLALASALLAILLVGREPATRPAALTAAAFLTTLTTALLLYSQASLPAVVVLASAIAAERLARLAEADTDSGGSNRRLALFCLLPLAAAILIARIDGGPISIY